MVDIFISYAREDLKKAKLLANALKAKGWSVWWDRDILPGTKFSEVIQKKVNESKCVLVLWSTAAVKSDFVLAEAAIGAERKVLVPAMIESATIPIDFRRIQAADLTSWKEGLYHEGFERLIQALYGLVGQPISVPLKKETTGLIKGIAPKDETTNIKHKLPEPKHHSSEPYKKISRTKIKFLIALIALGIVLAIPLFWRMQIDKVIVTKVRNESGGIAVEQSPPLRKITADVGGTLIDIQAPNGFYEVSQFAPNIRQHMEITTPSSNKLLAVFLSTNDVERIRKYESPKLSPFIQVQIAKEGENKIFYKDIYNREVQQYRKEIEHSLEIYKDVLAPTMTDIAGNFEKYYKRKLELKFGDIFPLGLIYEKEDAFAYCMIIKTQMTGEGKAMEHTLVNGMAILWIKGKIIHVSVLQDAKESSSIDQVKMTTREMTDLILLKNKIE